MHAHGFDTAVAPYCVEIFIFLVWDLVAIFVHVPPHVGELMGYYV